MAVIFDRMWKRFTQIIGREDLGKDPRFANSELRRRNRDYMNSLVEGWVADKTKEEVVKLLVEAGIPAGPINTVTEALEDPQIKARDMIVNIDQPGIGQVPVAGIVVKLSETPGSIESPAPQVGQNNRDIYTQLLNLSENDLAALSKEGVI